MFRKGVCLVIVVLGIGFLGNFSYALQLLTKEAALEKVFGQGVQVVKENKQLTDQQIAKVKEGLKGTLVCAQKGVGSQGVAENTNIDFYFSMKDGKKTGVAVIDEEPGKWGPVIFIVAMDLQGVVTRTEVLSYEEKRGQPIARHSFLSQFEGKNSKSHIQVEKDITGVSGATISSTCAAFAVKKATILYSVVYLNQ